MLSPIADVRRRVSGQLAGHPPPPRAFGAFGQDSWIVPPADVRGPEGILIGDRVVILEHAVLHADEGAQLTMGEGVRLARGVSIRCRESIELGRAVSSSDHVAISDTWDGDDPGAGDDGPVVIGEGAYLGFGSFVGPGVTIGAGAYVGEGAVVLEDVAPHTVVYGNPASVIRTMGADARWSGRRFP